MLRRVLLSLVIGLGAAALLIVADVAVIAYWQPRWLVECVSDPIPPQPASTTTAPKSDLQIATYETFVSGSVCTDRFGLPASLTFGVLAGALSYRRLKRR